MLLAARIGPARRLIERLYDRVGGPGPRASAVARTRLARRVKQRAALEGADLALREVYASYLRLLRRRAQIAPAPTDTDDAILERIGRARGAAAKDAAARFVQSYREARYRRAPWRPESFASSLEDLARALAQA